MTRLREHDPRCLAPIDGGPCECEPPARTDREEIVALRAALRGLLPLLDRCRECQRVATHMHPYGLGEPMYCEEHAHGGDVGDSPEAAAVRAALALLGDGGG